MTILNQTEITVENCPVIGGLSIFILFISISLLLAILCSGYLLVEYKLSILFLILSIVSAVGAWYGTHYVPTGRYRYEALMDETYSAEEFLSKYKMIDQHGKIYVLEDIDVR